MTAAVAEFALAHVFQLVDAGVLPGDQEELILAYRLAEILPGVALRPRGIGGDVVAGDELDFALGDEVVGIAAADDLVEIDLETIPFPSARFIDHMHESQMAR